MFYMLASIIVGRWPRRTSASEGRERSMWIIEFNVAGYRFTREVPDLRHRAFRFSPRNMHWRTLRHTHAA